MQPENDQRPRTWRDWARAAVIFVGVSFPVSVLANMGFDDMSFREAVDFYVQFAVIMAVVYGVWFAYKAYRRRRRQ